MDFVVNSLVASVLAGKEKNSWKPTKLEYQVSLLAQWLVGRGGVAGGGKLI